MIFQSRLPVVSIIPLNLIKEKTLLEMKLFVILAAIFGIFIAYTVAIAKPCCCAPGMCMPVCDDCRPFPRNPVLVSLWKTQINADTFDIKKTNHK